jgi:hypothetical protein
MRPGGRFSEELRLKNRRQSVPPLVQWLLLIDDVATEISNHGERRSSEPMIKRVPAYSTGIRLRMHDS